MRNNAARARQVQDDMYLSGEVIDHDAYLLNQSIEEMWNQAVNREASQDLYDSIIEVMARCNKFACEVLLALDKQGVKA